MSHTLITIIVLYIVLFSEHVKMLMLKVNTGQVYNVNINIYCILYVNIYILI
jgi:hypothetical protein